MYAVRHVVPACTVKRHGVPMDMVRHVGPMYMVRNADVQYCFFFALSTPSFGFLLLLWPSGRWP